MVHPERHSGLEREDGALGPMGNGDCEESVPVVQVQGWREGREGHDHLDRQPWRQAHRRSAYCMSFARGFCRQDRITVIVQRCLLAVIALVLVPSALAQASTADEIARYRAALQDGNPAELWEIRGADLWKQKRGPKQVS